MVTPSLTAGNNTVPMNAPTTKKIKQNETERYRILLRRACILFILVLGLVQIFTTLSVLARSATTTTRKSSMAMTTTDHQSATIQKISNNNNTNERGKSNSLYGVTFVFIMGLEGTGHHTVGSLVQESPSTRILTKVGIHPNKTIALANSLVHNSDYGGLFDAHCYGAETPANSEVNADKDPDVAFYLQTVVNHLRDIHQMAQNANATATLAINGWAGESVWSLGLQSGMMSYPNFKQHCRKVNYVKIDLLYQACDKAEVECRHLYIHRDPHAVLRSSNRRGMHATILEAIHLYISQLQIIHSQLYRHGGSGGPQGEGRTLGCMGLLDDVEGTISSNWDDVWTPFYKLWGWTSRADFQAVFDQVYKSPTVMTRQQKQQLVPLKLRPYMNSFIQLHYDVIELCQSQIGGGGD